MGPTGSNGQRQIGERLVLEDEWARSAQIRQQLSTILTIVGERQESEHQLILAKRDLQESEKQGEAALELAIELEIDQDKMLPPQVLVAKVRTMQVQLPSLVRELFEVAERHVPHQELAYRELEQLNTALVEQFSHPVDHQRLATAFLDTLEQFLKRVEHLAEDYEELRNAWLRHVDALAMILKS
jgi:hypothetical protein